MAILATRARNPSCLAVASPQPPQTTYIAVLTVSLCSLKIPVHGTYRKPCSIRDNVCWPTPAPFEFLCFDRCLHAPDTPATHIVSSYSCASVSFQRPRDLAGTGPSGLASCTAIAILHHNGLHGHPRPAPCVPWRHKLFLSSMICLLFAHAVSSSPPGRCRPGATCSQCARVHTAARTCTLTSNNTNLL